MSTNVSSVAEFTDLGRVRLSKHFSFREMLYSEVSNAFGVPNLPEDPDLAIEVGTRLCEDILEPLHAAFGHVSVISAYHSPALNKLCNERFVLGDTTCWWTDNTDNAAQHIWDRRDSQGFRGGAVTVVLPGYLSFYEKTRDYRPLAWWIRDNIPAYAEIFFFLRHQCAFKIRWHEGPSDKAIWYLDPPERELFTREGMDNFQGTHRQYYDDIIGDL